MKDYLSLSVIARTLSVGLLIIAIFKLPYGYYTFLRWIVFISSGYSAYISFLNQKNIWVIILGILAIIFNPIIPIYLKKETWIIIDIFSVFILALSTIYIREDFKSLVK